MNNLLRSIMRSSFLIIGCNTKSHTHYEIAGEQSKIIAEMINAVNEKDAEKYVADTFEQGKVVKVDVIQPRDLFGN